MTTPTIRPAPDELTGEFWAAAARGQLMLQHCDACGEVNQPPQPMCGYCGSTSLAFKNAGTSGVIYSWTTSLRRPGAAKAAGGALAGEPDTVLVVAVGGNPDALLCGHVEGRPAWVQIGAPVTVTFRDLSYTEDGEERTITLPDFTSAATATKEA